MLEVDGLSKTYDGVPVLTEVSFRIDRGEVGVLTGANGAGKSTLWECLLGAQPYDRGVVKLHGREVRATSRVHWREVYGIVDDFAWFPDLSVADHLRLLAPEVSGESLEQAGEAWGIEGLLDRLPATLSSGQRQRCALLSAAVRDWSVLIVDEPERHLDADAVPAAASHLAAFADRGAVLIASHHPAFAYLPGVRRFHLAEGRLSEQ